MNTALKLILIAALATGFEVFSHSDHHHSKKAVKVEVIKKNAGTYLQDLIQKKKLAASWQGAKLVSANKKKFGKKTEWVVTYENNVQKKLFIFITLAGEYAAANHTGK